MNVNGISDIWGNMRFAPDPLQVGNQYRTLALSVLLGQSLIFVQTDKIQIYLATSGRDETMTAGSRNLKRNFERSW